MEAARHQTNDPLSKRPRLARIIHLLLASQGVTQFQERVPIKLADFAYRYTSSVLSDCLALSADGYCGQTSTTTGGGHGGRGAKHAEQEGHITLPALKLAMASRLSFHFNTALSKEEQMEIAQEMNKIALPKPEREFGVRLPPERFCFTGVGWGVKEEWESEGEEDEDMEAEPVQVEGGDEVMGEAGEKIDEDEFEDAMGTLEDDQEMAGS